MRPQYMLISEHSPLPASMSPPRVGPLWEAPSSLLPLLIAAYTVKSGQTSPPPRSLPPSNQAGLGRVLQAFLCLKLPSTLAPACFCLLVYLPFPPIPELWEGWEHVPYITVGPRPTARADTRQPSGRAADTIINALAGDQSINESMREPLSIKKTSRKCP